jgi:hypothetical protein
VGRDQGVIEELPPGHQGASNKQIKRELLKYFKEAELVEIEAALIRAEQMMGEKIGRLLPPP